MNNKILQNFSMLNINAVILAAGDGTRMNSGIPKALHRVANLELINHLLRNLEKLRIMDAILVCDESFEFKNKSQVKIRKIVQAQKLGTGHAVKLASSFLHNEVTIILYGDTPLVQPATLQKLIEKNDDLGLLLFEVSNENSSYGRVLVEDGKVRKIVEFSEDHQAKKTSLGNSGVIVIKTRLLSRYLPLLENKNSKKEYYLTDVINFAIKDKKNIGYIVTDERESIGINTREDLVRAEQSFHNMKRKFFLESGVTLIDPATVYFSYDTEIEKDAIIHQNVVFGEGVKIGSGAEILPFCHIEGVEVGTEAKIGPFARIRGETEINSNTEIGNFVEIKNSKIHQHVRIKHLSYIGDTEVGKGTNIGAGTITCNFDGKEKHRTSIGGNCLVGANNAIVAPLKIGDNARTGAGSTITYDVPNDSLAIGRARQENKVDSNKSKS